MLSSPRPAAGVITLGETLAAVSSTRAGSLAPGMPLHLSFAGAESTVAIGVARLGHRAAWIGRVGDDDAGRMVLRGLRGEGIFVHSARAGASSPTAMMLRQQRTADQVHVTYYRSGSAGSQLDEIDVDPTLIAEAAVLHISGITPALGPGPARAVAHAVAAAREHGTLVSFDVNYRRALWSIEQAAATLGPIAHCADILFAGPEELELVSDAGLRTADQRAANLHTAGVGEVVVKDGGQGAWTLSAEGVSRIKALPVTCVDPIGAGDAFAAGYLSAVLDGLPVAGRLHRAAICGAACVSTHGDWEGLPHRNELSTFDTTIDVRR